MDSFNKVISFVLGLVVVLVFFAVVTGKINLKSKTSSTPNLNTVISPTPVKKNTGGFFSFLKPVSPTPTPTSTQKPLSSVTINNNENNTYKNTSPKSIPSTGLPTVFIPILFSGLAGGNFLRKIGKK
ncbi:MAG: hypothetical protein WCT22_04885 [Patescibacteria group bacterium]|jgi:hypothetical protein